MHKSRFETFRGGVRTGQLKDLGLNMEQEFMAIRKVYDLKPTV